MTDKKIEELTLLVNKFDEEIGVIDLQMHTMPSASDPESLTLTFNQT